MGGAVNVGAYCFFINRWALLFHLTTDFFHTEKVSFSRRSFEKGFLTFFIC